MKKKSAIQPNWDHPIKLSITPTEALSLAGDYTSATTSWKRLTKYYEEVAQDYLVVKNPRTGLECRMLLSDSPPRETDGDQDLGMQYIVELNTGHGFVIAYFEGSAANFAELACLKGEAEKTFIAWSTLIGVKLERRLVSAYPNR